MHDVEHGYFTPLVFTTIGGMGDAAAQVYKRLAGLLSDKHNLSYAWGGDGDSMYTKLCFGKVCHHVYPCCSITATFTSFGDTNEQIAKAHL